MTNVLHLHRRLLLAILRAPVPGVRVHSVQRPARLIHTSPRWLGNAPSVSFGAETDQLLETYTTKSKRRSKAKSKSKSNTETAKEAKDQTITQAQENTKVEREAHSSEGDLSYPESATLSFSDSAPSGSTKLGCPRSQGQTSGIDIHDVTDAVHKSRKAIAASRPLSEGENRTRKTERTHQTKNSWSKSQSTAQTQYAGSRSKQTVTFGPRRKIEPWQVQKDALKRKFGDQKWQPRKLVSPDAMEGIRSLHEQDPERYSTPFLADRFKLSPEAVRRILKSKWRPTEEQMQARRERWARRHDRIWDHMAAIGLRPERTKDKEVEGPEAFEEELRAKQALGQL